MMKSTPRTILTGIIILFAAAALLWAGYSYGRRSAAGFSFTSVQNFWPTAARGWMKHSQEQMMGGLPTSGLSQRGQSRGFHGSSPRRTTAAEPLDPAVALKAVELYLSTLELQGLAPGEIMIFENNAYAVIKEETGDMGAFEVLIDPATKKVFPEPGPNMMWNLKYLHHNHKPGEGPMMRGGFSPAAPVVNPDYAAQANLSMPISPEEAREIAGEYLMTSQPDLEVSEHMTTFYGYYTIDLESEGEITGMLSVNGYTGRIFYHHWHGEFIGHSPR